MKNALRIRTVPLLALVLFSAAGCHRDHDSGGGHCDGCKSTADCGDGLSCYIFSDGRNRCATGVGDKCPAYLRVGDPQRAGTGDESRGEQALRVSSAVLTDGRMGLDDLNGDGVPDIVLVDEDPEGVPWLQVAISAPLGGYADWRTIDLDFSPTAVTVCDVNGDEVFDLVVDDPQGENHTLIGHGDGTFDPARPGIAWDAAATH